MRPILIVGYGNPLRGDDGAGSLAAAALAALWPEAEVRVEASQQLLVEMAQSAAEAEFVIFVDAGRDGEPGEVRTRPVETVELGRPSLTHHLTPETLIALAESLYGRRPEAILATICGVDFGHGEELSAAVQYALPRLVSRVAGIVEQRLKERAHA